MPDIANPVSLKATDQIVIDSKENDPSFAHTNWGDDDLQAFRKTVRDYYRQIQNGHCVYCQKEISLVSTGNSHVEHIAPKSLYIEWIFEPKNLCVICADCNQIKRNQETLNAVVDTVNNGGRRRRYPRSSSAFKIVHPHFDTYTEHIIKLGDSYYIDRSAKGHFTIGACNLNRRLYEFGWEKDIIDDCDIMKSMATYLGSKNIIEKMNCLSDLKKMLIQV